MGYIVDSLVDSALIYGKSEGVMKSRVTITYKDPEGSNKEIELPFVLGVMSDLSGNAPAEPKAPLAKREFEKIEEVGVTKLMADVKPGLAVSVPNKLDEGSDGELGVELKFRSMDDFSPPRIAKQVPALNDLLEMRQNLQTLRRLMITKPGVRDQVAKLLEDPDLMKVLAEQADADAANKAGAGDTGEEEA